MAEKVIRFQAPFHLEKFNGFGEMVLGRNCNGSGPKAFGGAKEWPVVTLKLPFPPGEQARALLAAREIMAFLKRRGLAKDFTDFPEIVG